MNAKLDNITTQYRKFNENQVLTEGQLNEFIDYFEDQDRLSRTRLSGVGIVCGFKSVFFDESMSKNDKVLREIFREKKPELKDYLDTIVITQGAGVTTDGDLITLRRKIEKTVANSEKKVIETVIDFDTNAYRYYRTYQIDVQYPHFKQISLLEIITQQDYDLLESQEAKDSFKEVKDIEKLSNKIVILYLESYSNQESPCEDADCDNAGAEQVSNLRVLLADSQDAEDLLVEDGATDTLYNLHNKYEKLYDSLPRIEAKRVILDSSITTPSQLKTRFYDSINAVPALVDGFDKISATFNLNDTSINAKISSLLNTSTLSLVDYQYRYDLFKDLIDTYNEIKGLLLHLDAECCPNINSFPKHLMLGALGATLELGEKADLRHSFYHSPVTTGDDENYERVIMLIKRFIEKVNKFKSHNGPVKITPSNLYVRLGNKAVPYYYNVDQPLLAQWNFEKTKTDRETYNLSYHTANLAADDYVQNPLNYNIDNYDFYRIEGHLGLPYETAVQNINDLKVKYGLPFDVGVLLLNKGEKTGGDLPSEPRKLSVEDLRKRLVSISDDISKEKGDYKSTLLNLSKLDSDLKLLNKAAFTASGSDKEIVIVKEDPKKKELATELLNDFLERKSGLEHLAGVERGGLFLLIAESESNNQVLADFSLPYLCCSKKDPVFLVLPASQLCQNDAPIAMTIVPLDGQVKAFVNGSTPITAITQSAGQSFFDPGLVGSAYFGQTITFTVNDDPVDVQMMVNEVPNVVVTASTPVNGESPTNPTATVVFTVSGSNLSGFDYSWNFGDGKSEQVNDPVVTNGLVKQTHVYNLTAGKEDTFTPILTVTNSSGCSKQYVLQPLKLTGQSTVQCLSSMEIIVQYNQSLGPCPGGHTCNNAKFHLMANGIVNLGLVNLNNLGTSLQPGQSRPNNETSGPNRINSFLITPAQAQSIANTDPNGDGFISFSLVCAEAVCHTGVAWTTIKLGGNVIYNGCPTNNFLTINPCTGKIKP
ncbi:MULTISPECIES: PKD domain-containing protein [Chryseobacterium]|uniref:PKD domain-containing protein n=1 Tax=Chryseobacterium taihuense TaxID=1141221 RepID=A0A4U8WFA9_9FLAO|nr:MULTISPECIES: PKD domain-containing protein [Chryseobacterium]QQV01676.1 PKD domain-containing protein [Chryseobacterium sp. FDAARGOS 1104]VFB05122.1 Uncharacterised protein [Chryseobacterium taihuense]